MSGNGDHVHTVPARRHVPRRAFLALAAPFLLPSGARAQGRGTIAFLGDIMLSRDISLLLRQHPPEWFWGDVLPVLQGADAAIGNLEAPLTDHDIEGGRTPKWYRFRASPAAAGIPHAGRVRAVALANNHILDFGETGLADTRYHLAERRIAFAGAGPDLAAASAPAWLDLPNCRIGLISATDQISEFGARSDRPGTWYLRFSDGAPGLAQIGEGVASLRRGGAELVVLSLHWGPNLRRRPTAAVRAFAHAAVALGVDVVHGHSAHLVQGIERVGRGLVLYDTGNCIDDYWRFLFVRQEWCFVFLLDHQAGRMRRLRLVPYYNQPIPLRLAHNEKRATMQAHMRTLCAPFGTMLEETEDGLVLPLGPD